MRDEGHAVDAIVRRVQGRGAAVSFFVLDACRDNPLAASGSAQHRRNARADPRRYAERRVRAVLGGARTDRARPSRRRRSRSELRVHAQARAAAEDAGPYASCARQARAARGRCSLAASVRHPQQPAYYDQIIGEIELSPGAPASDRISQRRNCLRLPPYSPPTSADGADRKPPAPAPTALRASWSRSPLSTPPAPVAPPNTCRACARHGSKAGGSSAAGGRYHCGRGRWADHRPICVVRRGAEERGRDGGCRHQRRRWRAGQEARPLHWGRCLRSEAGRGGREPNDRCQASSSWPGIFAPDRRSRRRRSMPKANMVEISPASTNPDLYRRPRRAEHLSRLRARRPTGRRRRQISCGSFRRQKGRYRP